MRFRIHGNADTHIDGLGHVMDVPQAWASPGLAAFVNARDDLGLTGAPER
jgi:hypothetical protein